jgi:hypothetical protein
MRKIEEKMIDAINYRQNWASDNTIVEIVDDEIIVKLHFHPIARISKNSIQISSCGYRTKTTKSRLNAILSHFGVERIYQQDFVWYINNELFIDGMSITLH